MECLNTVCCFANNTQRKKRRKKKIKVDLLDNRSALDFEFVQSVFTTRFKTKIYLERDNQVSIQIDVLHNTNTKKENYEIQILD